MEIHFKFLKYLHAVSLFKYFIIYSFAYDIYNLDT